MIRSQIGPYAEATNEWTEFALGVKIPWSEKYDVLTLDHFTPLPRKTVVKNLIGRFTDLWIVLLTAPSQDCSQWYSAAFVPNHSCGAVMNSHHLPINQSKTTYKLEQIPKPVKEKFH